MQQEKLVMSHDALRQQHPGVHLHLITHPNSNVVSYETELQRQTHINRVPTLSFTLSSDMEG